MAPATCATEPALTRFLRLGASAAAAIAAVLFVLASVVRAFYAVTAHDALLRALLVTVSSVLLLATCWSLSDAKRGHLPALLVGGGSFFALGLSYEGGVMGAAPAPVVALTGPLPQAGLIACCIICTQIGAKLAQRAACNCE